MESHIKILGILHVVLGGMGILGAIAILVVFGGIAGIVGSTAAPNDSAIAIPILGGIGSIIAVVLLALSLPGFIGGVALLNMTSWSRIYMIVISALYLVHVPIGTALGIYGLWVLTKPETEALLSGTRRYA